MQYLLLILISFLMKMNFFLFPILLKVVCLSSSKKTFFGSTSSFSLFCPLSTSKKRKLLLGASAGFPAEESSDSAFYAILSRNTNVGGWYSLSITGIAAKWVPADSAIYANGLASTPSSDSLARSAMTVKASVVRRFDCFTDKLQSNLQQLLLRRSAHFWWRQTMKKKEEENLKKKK